MRFSYEYYGDAFGGKLTEAEFERFSSEALDVLSALTGIDTRRISENGCETMFRALCLQTEYLHDNLSERSSVKRESLGDWSVTYADNKKTDGRADVCGVPVAPSVISALTAGGYLTRWV